MNDLVNDESRPLVTLKQKDDLDSVSIEPVWTYSIIHSSADVVKREEDGSFPIFLIAGPKIKFFRLIQVYSFFLIVFLYRTYWQNSGALLITMVSEVFDINDESAPGPLVVYLMPVFVFSLPYLLSVFFGFISDYTHYQRAYLISYSFSASCLSAFLLMVCSYLVTAPSAEIFLPTIGFPIAQIFVILSIILYILGVSIFLPISLAYGLDLLGGTKWEVLYLYFPVFYVVNNLADITGYMNYIYLPDGYLRSNCLAAFIVISGVWLLFGLFRLFRIFPTFDPEIFDLISIRKGYEIFMNAVRRRRSGEKPPRGHWFIQLSSDAFSGNPTSLGQSREEGQNKVYPRLQVQMVASFFEINFLLFLLLLLFTATQIMETLFPQQSLTLRWPYSNSSIDFCADPKTKDGPANVYSLITVNNITVVLLTPLIEFYFYKIIFFFNSTENLNTEEGKTILKKICKCLRCFDRYWIPYDPILKRIFWGSIFGFISMVLAFSVEVGRLNSNHFNLTCHNNITTKPVMYTFSSLSVFAQFPQYITSGILEIFAYIGCIHFVYFQSSKTYKDSLKGLFFGLYYFYYGLASFVPLLIYYVMAVLCSLIAGGCQYCLSYVTTCSSSRFQFAWIPWVVLIVEFIVLIVFFAWFAHYRHWKVANIKNRGDRFLDQ